jgi:hypothetical protein
VTPNRNHRLADGERPWNRYHVREFNPSEFEGVLTGALADVEVFGIHGTPMLEQVERARVARARRLARIDRLGLRYVLPEGIDTRLRGLLKRRANTCVAPDAPAFSLSDMSHSRDLVESSLDLLAVSRV